MGMFFVGETKERLQGLEADRARWMQELKKTGRGSERFEDVQLMIAQIDADIREAELDGGQDFSRLSSIETAGDLKKQKIQKGETNMGRHQFAHGEDQNDRMNFSEFLELKRQKEKIQNEQKLYPPGSVFFFQNKANLKRIDERMEDLKENIPASYFSPGEIKKSITQDHPFIDSRLRSVEEMAKEIADLDDAIKNCGPSQDRGAMIRNRAALNEVLAVKAALLKAKRSDRGGRL